MTQSFSDAAIAITGASTVALEFLFLATTCLSTYPILAFASLTYLDWASCTNCHFMQLCVQNSWTRLWVKLSHQNHFTNRCQFRWEWTSLTFLATTLYLSTGTQ